MKFMASRVETLPHGTAGLRHQANVAPTAQSRHAHCVIRTFGSGETHVWIHPGYLSWREMKWATLPGFEARWVFRLSGRHSSGSRGMSHLRYVPKQHKGDIPLVLLTSGTQDRSPSGRMSSEQSTQKKRPAPRGTAAYPRKRAVTACQVCRARRTKCDNAKPTCSFCLKIGAHCVQSPSDLSSFDPASLRILERLDDLELAIHAAATTTSTGPNVSLLPPRRSVQSHVAAHFQLLPANLEHVLWSSCFQETDSKKLELLEILRRPTNATPWSPAESFSPTINADLEPRSTRIILDNFFQFCHVKNPIIDNEPAARRMVARIALHGVDWSPQSCLALLICALGAISTPFGDSGSTLPGTTAYMTSQSYFQAATEEARDVDFVSRRD